MLKRALYMLALSLLMLLFMGLMVVSAENGLPAPARTPQQVAMVALPATGFEAVQPVAASSPVLPHNQPFVHLAAPPPAANFDADSNGIPMYAACYYRAAYFAFHLMDGAG